MRLAEGICPVNMRQSQTMLNQQQQDQFNRDGFLNAGPVLSEDELAGLTEELNRIIDKGPDGFEDDEPRPVLFRALNPNSDRPVYQIVNIWEASPAFEKLLYHPFVVKAISQLTGMGDLQIWHDQIQYKPAGQGGTTNWHQDAPAWPPLQPQTPVSAWIPFDDADTDNGCMWMVPGSHKWGPRGKEMGALGALQTRDDFAKINDMGMEVEGHKVAAQPCPVKRGEVHFHHSLTWHGSPWNESNRPRRALAIHYMTSETRIVRRAGHPMEQFIDLPLEGSMWEAGVHFPIVSRDGEPVGPPATLYSTQPPDPRSLRVGTRSRKAATSNAPADSYY